MNKANKRWKSGARKGNGTVESSRRAGRAFFFIDFNPQIVQMGNSFLKRVVVVCGAGKAVFPAGDWFRKHSVWISTKRLWENPNPYKTASGGDVDEGGDLRQIQQR